MLKMGRFIRRSFLNNFWLYLLVIAALFCMNYSVILGIVSGEGWLRYLAEIYTGCEGFHPSFFAFFSIGFVFSLFILFFPYIKENVFLKDGRLYTNRFHKNLVKKAGETLRRGE